LGAAPDWRPIEWITGGSGTGKSTLMKLTRWVFGPRAMITSEDATPAGIKHRTKNSALPVSIDELESEGKNERARDITKLARISSSGGESLRGIAIRRRHGLHGAQCLSVFVHRDPVLPQQDKNRMAILALEPVEWEGAKPKPVVREPGEDWEVDDEDVVDEEDTILGSRAEWGRVGQGLRGRCWRSGRAIARPFAPIARRWRRPATMPAAATSSARWARPMTCLMFDGLEER
jgi:hypothetical protein